MLTRLSRGCLAAAVVAAAWPGAASAAPRASPYDDFGVFVPTVRLMGDDPVWLERRRDGGVRVAASARARGPARTLGVLAGPGASEVTFADLAASPAGWAAGFVQGYLSSGRGQPTVPRGAAVMAAPVGAAPRTVVRCKGRSGVPSVSLSGDVLASTLSPCSDPDPDIELREPASSSAPVAPAPASVYFGVAGRYLWRLADGDDVVVTDWREQREVYRVDLGGSGNVDVQDDGTLAYARPEGDGWRLFVAAPSEPALRELPVRPRLESPLRIAGNRIVFGRRAQSGYELVSIDLAGGDERVLARRLADPAFDFDGQRLAWFAPSCAGTRVRFTRDLGGVGAVERPRCRRLPLISGPRLRRGRLHVRFACSGFSAPFGGCRSRVRVRTAGGRPLGSARSGPVAGGPADSSTARVRIAPAGRALLRRRGARVVLTATIEDALGRIERRKATVAIRR